MILDVFFNVICILFSIILALILILLFLKITLIIRYNENKIEVFVKVFNFKINLLKNARLKKTVKADSEKEMQDIEENVKKDVRYKEKETKLKESNIAKLEIEDYLEILSLSLEILDELTKSITFKKVKIYCWFSFEDPAKTAKMLGHIWTTYGNVTAFLYSNFKIKDYDINFIPLWNADSKKIDVDADIVLNTRLLRIIRHTKIKNLMKIKKRVIK